MRQKEYEQQANFTKRYLQSNFDNKIELSSKLLNEITSMSMQKGDFIPIDFENTLVKN